MNIYLYDGSFEGLLTAIFYSFADKDELDIQRAALYQPTLLSVPLAITTEDEKVRRVSQSIQERLSWQTWKNIYYLYLSDLSGSEYLSYRYLKLCYRHGDTINLSKDHPIIHQVDQIRYKVTYEAHRFKGFVRFVELAPLVFYSKIEPDHNILPLLAHHFSKRFSDQKFMIHDLHRQYALVYDLHHTYFHDLTAAEADRLTAQRPDDPYQDLFAIFFDATKIPERYNPRLQRYWMPKRYWKHIDEAH